MNPGIESLGIEEQVLRLETIADPRSRAAALDLLASVLKLHAEGLERLLKIARASASEEEKLSAALRRDPLVRALLLLHDLDQRTPEVRVREALTELGPRLEKLGAQLTIIGLEERAVSIRVRTRGSGCGTTPESIRSMVESTILEAAPDLDQIEVQLEPEPGTLIPVSAIQPAASSRTLQGK
jgi:Fe-S cluster biogenesis protein NfuA